MRPAPSVLGRFAVVALLGAGTATSAQHVRPDGQIDLNTDRLSGSGMFKAGGGPFNPNLDTVILVHGRAPTPDTFDPLVAALQDTHNVFIYGYDSQMMAAANLGEWDTANLAAHADSVDNLTEASDGLVRGVRQLTHQTGPNGIGSTGVTIAGYSQGGPVTRFATSTHEGYTLASSDPDAMPINLIGLVPLSRGMAGLTGVGSTVVSRWFAGTFSSYSAALADPASPVLTAPLGANVTYSVGISPDDGVITPDGQTPPPGVKRPDHTFPLTGSHDAVPSISGNVSAIVAEIERGERARPGSNASKRTATGTSSVPTGSTAPVNSIGTSAGSTFDGNLHLDTSIASSAPQVLNSRAAGAGRRNGPTQAMIIFRIVIAVPPAPTPAGGGTLRPGGLLASRRQRASAPRLWIAGAQRPWAMSAMGIGAGWNAVQSSEPAITAKFAARGVSTGRAFDIEMVNRGSDAVDGVASGVVVEPLDPGSTRRVIDGFAAAARGQTVAQSSAYGYCLEFEREPPRPGVVFRIAPPEVQRKFEPMRRILAAARSLEDAGAMHPDSEPLEYFHAIRQWAVWSHERGFNAAKFTDAFVEHARKNVTAAGRPWTRSLESTLRGLAPNRWQDIQQVLNAAVK